jgi:membrane associated rhomboid family serine protease
MMQAIVAFFLAGFLSCAGLTWWVSDSHDGQAGMGAALGGFYVGILAAVIVFVISLRRGNVKSQ